MLCSARERASQARRSLRLRETAAKSHPERLDAQPAVAWAVGWEHQTARTTPALSLLPLCEAPRHGARHPAIGCPIWPHHDGRALMRQGRQLEPPALGASAIEVPLGALARPYAPSLSGLFRCVE